MCTKKEVGEENSKKRELEGEKVGGEKEREIKKIEGGGW